MQLNNSFTVPAAPDVAWQVLLDVPRIAPCMPGAELTEVVGEHSYKGNAKLRVGPVNLTFSGTAEITELDAAARTATVHAAGNDTKGRGAAEADVVFALVEDGGQTRVDITTELNLTGSVAQYGRASGLIDAIAGQIISDFATNLEAEIGTDAGAPAGTTGDATATEPVSQPAAEAASSDNSISGISLFFRAIWAMICGKR
jgi:carbon monoxide dehydrogenase subunit G